MTVLRGTLQIGDARNWKTAELVELGMRGTGNGGGA